jgi:uncharacterized protein (DUF4415 family)
MAKVRRPEVTDPDNPEWTEADFARARPGKEILPEEVLRLFGRKGGRPQKESKKMPVSIRLSPNVVEHFKAAGPGWQSRIDETLSSLVKRRERTGKGVSPARDPKSGKTAFLEAASGRSVATSAKSESKRQPAKKK